MPWSKILKERNTDGLRVGSYRIRQLGSRDEEIPSRAERSDFRRISLEDDPSPERLAEIEEESKACGIIEEAKAKAQLIEKEAYEKAFEQGEKAGRELAYMKFQSALESLRKAQQQLQALKAELLRRSEAELLFLSLAIANKIIQRQIDLDEGFVSELIRCCLKYVIDRDNVRIHLNPTDYSQIMELREKKEPGTEYLEGLLLQADPEVGRGGVLIRTAYGEIDGRIERRLAEIQAYLQETFKREQA